MNKPSILPIAALLILALPACDRQSEEVARQISKLEQQNQEAAERQRELELQLEDQKLAAERDAIERERAKIEEDRIELERQAGQVAADQEEALRNREAEIARREGKLEQLQATLDEKEDDLGKRGQELSGNDLEIAGRESLPFEAEEQTVPVGDYGTFYDSLSSYGSWFETPDYGYVWQPAVVREAGWRPYSRGRWVCSDRGWTWVSEEPFGWATYHYGRWALVSGHGWIWVPGSEWAPCWVSWRENDSHIGWAPLPPETLAWRGDSWDSTVDVRFGIGAAWFNFVEIRNFGNPIYRYCLPVSGNRGWYGNTRNITYIHTRNRQVICGGPRYQRINERIGRPVPFYRLEVDRHPRMGGGQLAMRPEIKDGRLRVSAPDMDAAWNAGLRPKQVRGRIEKVNVERSAALDKDITDRFRQSRMESRQRADKSIADLGGRDRFEENRKQKLKVNREQLEAARPKAVVRDKERNPIQPDREISKKQGGQPQKQAGSKATPPRNGNALPDGVTRGDERKPGPAGGRSENGGRAEVSPGKMDQPRPVQKQDAKETRTADGQPRVTPKEPAKPRESQGKGRQLETRVESNRQAVEAIEKENAGRKQRELAEQAQQRQAEQVREAQKDASRRNSEDQARQRQQQEKQRQDDQERQKQQEKQRQDNQALEQSRKQQAAQEETRRQQQEQQQRDARRQQEQEVQRQQEQARQRQQEQEQQQRQQEQARQRQQEQEQQQRQQEQGRQRQQEQEQQQRQQQEQGRQRQQEQAREQRQQEERSRQQQQKQDDNSGKRNR